VVRALLLENPHATADPALREAGIDIVRHSGAMDEDELIEALDGVQVLGIRSKTNVTKRVLEAAPSLLTIGAFCIGTNQIDLATAAESGVTVFNAPFSNTRSVVELTLAEIIALSRRLTERDRAMHEGTWQKTAAGSHEVRGRTLGIVGYGNIGTQLSVLAEAMGLRVIFYDTAERLALGNARRMHSLEELLDEADIVTLHVDGRAGNAGMFGAAEFARMRAGSIFLNLSRGFLVDYDSLREHILSGKIAGAGVDVFPHEPKSSGDPFESQLRGLPNVILTPHIGGSTMEAQEGIGSFVSNKLVRYLATGTTTMSVNVPPLQLDQSATARWRVTYLHRNMPGMMAQVNQACADSGVNIEGQILGNLGNIGYVIVDIDGELTPAAQSTLSSLPGSIRLRILPTHAG